MKAYTPCILMPLCFMVALATAIPGFAAAQKDSTPAQDGQQAPVQMNNATVVRMVQAKISTDLIVLAISKCEPHFQLDGDNAKLMGQMGVTDEIIKAMTAKQNVQPVTGSETEVPVQATSLLPASGVEQTHAIIKGKPRVFLQSASHGNNWNARRDQSMEMSKDFERACPEVRITLNQSAADYTVALNHIEVGLFVRDNQFQIADKNGDLLAKTKEGGSINGGVKKVCAQILEDWATKR
jgi:hypothetical protein